MAAEQPQPEGSKALSGLLSGIAQAAYYGHAGISEELLRGQLYPEAAPHEFRALLAKMSGVLKESEFLCLEFDEAKVTQMLKKLSEIEESITALTQTT
ncbi:COMM domain-containing protein 1 [Terrapene carolina triunguis]|uniref:COMM domain-containing protein 1 n=1 Tax=Terrapene triunguis TaxID=2587831 RepID=UPI00115625AF|nr:COMM domain-containing protein 1 [Terrapene carolina triunguis]